MSVSLNSVEPIRRETLQKAVYEQLCELILNGALAPGESVTVASIASAFDVSPMPVREAITRLMGSGALTVVAGRSIGVPQLDEATFTDLRNVRLEIESVCVRWAMANTTPEFVSDVRSKLEAMVSAEQAGDAKDFIQANYEFHFAIYRQADSPALLEVVSNIWLRINPHFHLLSEFGHYRISNEQHREIYNGIKDGNVEQAVNALREDINGAYETMAAANFGQRNKGD